MKVQSSSSNADNDRIISNKNFKNTGQITEKINSPINEGQAKHWPANKDHNKDFHRIQGAVNVANDVMQVIDKGFEFEIHEATDRIMIRVVDKRKDIVIREIPPEEMLNMLGKIWEIVGILIDEKI